MYMVTTYCELLEISKDNNQTQMCKEAFDMPSKKNKVLLDRK